MYGSPMPDRLTLGHISRLRRSTAMSPALPAAELAWLLDEAERLVKDEAETARLVHRLTGPWSEVRGALNELHRRFADTAR